MQNAQPNLFTRHDTIFGVCEGLGEDLGFNPLWLRLALPLLLFINPVATLAGYAAAGAIVFATRLLVPNPRPAIARSAGASALPERRAAARHKLETDAENDAEAIAIAA